MCGDPINISNSYNTGNISGGGNTGGIIAHANYEVNISKSYNTGKITAKTGPYVGDLIGRADDCNITNSYNKGEITCLYGNYMYVGGIMGVSFGSYNVDSLIYQCYNEGNINCHNQAKCGGIAGQGVIIDQCYNVGIIKMTLSDNWHTEIGGISGSYDSITNCYNLGKLEIEGEGYGWIGGIIGHSYKLIENCYNIGEIDCKVNCTGHIYIGGIIGETSQRN